MDPANKSRDDKGGSRDDREDGSSFAKGRTDPALSRNLKPPALAGGRSPLSTGDLTTQRFVHRSVIWQRGSLQSGMLLVELSMIARLRTNSAWSRWSSAVPAKLCQPDGIHGVWR